MKGGRNTFYEQMQNKYGKLIEEIENLQHQISQLPEGSFYCTRNGKRYKWYQSFGNEKPANYISKSDRDFAEKLTLKKYLTLQIEDLIREKKAIESYLKKYPEDNSKFDEFMNHPEYQRLLAPNLNKQTLEFMKWMQEPYEKNSSHPEHLTHKTIIYSEEFFKDASAYLVRNCPRQEINYYV